MLEPEIQEKLVVLVLSLPAVSESGFPVMVNISKGKGLSIPSKGGPEDCG